MKKILILAYFYPPFNHISSQRPKSFADNFIKYSLYPIVVTRRYDESGRFYEDSFRPNTKNLEIIENQTHTEIRLPYFGKRYQLVEAVNKFPYAERILLSVHTAFGNLHAKTGMDECADSYLKNYLISNPVDYILATTPPLNSIKLGYKLSEKFNAPLIADFRDLWDNNLLKTEYRPSIAKNFQNAVETAYLKTWLKKAALVTAVSEPLIGEIQQLTPDAETLVVMNGYEKDLFTNFPGSENKAKFTFSVIGTIYPEQDLSILFEGMKIFLANKNLDEIQLNFIGTDYKREVGKNIASNLPEQCLNLSGRLPREEALQKMQETHILFHAGWKGYRGIASGKIFEYLGSRKKILIAPGDNDIMEKLVIETGAGKIANSPDEFANAMNEWFEQWKTLGRISYTGDYEKVLQYSRENQAAKLAKKIISL